MKLNITLEVQYSKKPISEKLWNEMGFELQRRFNDALEKGICNFEELSIEEKKLTIQVQAYDDKAIIRK